MALSSSSISSIYLIFFLCSGFVQSFLLPLEDLYHSRNRTNSKLSKIDLHCAHDENWGDADSFDISKCPAAARSIEEAEHLDPMRAAVPKEFITRNGISQHSRGDPIITPRKYTVGMYNESPPFDFWRRAFFIS